MDAKQTEALEVTHEAQPMATTEAASFHGVLAIIERAAKDPSVDVDKMERLLGMAERMQDRDAKQQYARAFAEMQKEIPVVKASKAVPNNDGGVRYKFAPYEEIMEQVRPIAARHGFSIAFSQRIDANRVVAICTLTHSAGHSHPNEFSVRIGSGPPKASEAQADGAASTYAKRFALCGALNITIEADSDANAIGAPISQKEAAEIESRIGNLKWDKEQIRRFLKWLGAKTTDEIQTSRMADALRFIADKERVAVTQ